MAITFTEEDLRRIQVNRNSDISEVLSRYIINSKHLNGIKIIVYDSLPLFSYYSRQIGDEKRTYFLYNFFGEEILGDEITLNEIPNRVFSRSDIERIYPFLDSQGYLIVNVYLRDLAETTICTMECDLTLKIKAGKRKIYNIPNIDKAEFEIGEKVLINNQHIGYVANVLWYSYINRYEFIYTCVCEQIGLHKIKYFNRHLVSI